MHIYWLVSLDPNITRNCLNYPFFDEIPGDYIIVYFYIEELNMINFVIDL